MNRIKFSTATLFWLGMGMFFSCQKDQNVLNEYRSDLQNSVDIEQINNYRPETEQLILVYHVFLDRIGAIQAKQDILKGDPNYPDTTIDVGIWQLETALNNEYGFKNDSIVFEKEALIFFEFVILGFDEYNIPIVSGEQLDSVYFQMVEYIEEGTLNDTMFWACIAALESVDMDKLTISIQPYRGKILRLNGVLPIGTDPQPFPAGTAIRSCNYYNGIPPLYVQIDAKISGARSFVFDPDYLIVYVNSLQFSWNSNPYIPDDRFWSGTSGNQLVYTNECNYYLSAQKDIVDANNPSQWNPNMFIGIYLMSAFESPWPVHLKTWWHYCAFDIYEKVFIGPGNPE